MKKIPAIILCTLCASALHAQPQISAGVRGGACFSREVGLEGHPYFYRTNISPRTAFAGGLFVESAFTGCFSLRIGIESLSGGENLDCNYYQELAYFDRTYSYTVENCATKFRYFTLPVTAIAGWNAGKNLRIYGGAGLRPGFLRKMENTGWAIRGEFETIGDYTLFVPSSVEGVRMREEPDKVHSFGLGLTALGGISRSFGANAIHLEGGFDYALTKTWKTGTDAVYGSGGHNRSFTLMLGYSRTLGK